MKGQIDSLRSKLKGMSKAEKAANKDAIKAQIQKLRDANKAWKVKLKEYYAAKLDQEVSKVK